jgi:hypothetical protein
MKTFANTIKAPAIGDSPTSSKHFFFHIVVEEREKLALDQELDLYTYSKII